MKSRREGRENYKRKEVEREWPNEVMVKKGNKESAQHLNERVCEEKNKKANNDTIEGK